MFQPHLKDEFYIVLLCHIRCTLMLTICSYDTTHINILPSLSSTPCSFMHSFCSPEYSSFIGFTSFLMKWDPSKSISAIISFSSAHIFMSFVERRCLINTIVSGWFVSLCPQTTYLQLVSPSSYRSVHCFLFHGNLHLHALPFHFLAPPWSIVSAFYFLQRNNYCEKFLLQWNIHSFVAVVAVPELC